MLHQVDNHKQPCYESSTYVASVWNSSKVKTDTSYVHNASELTISRTLSDSDIPYAVTDKSSQPISQESTGELES